MKDNKERRTLNPKEEKDISGGMDVDSKEIINKLKSKFKTEIIKPTMVAYGGPNIRPNLMKYGGPVIKPITPVVKPSTVPESTILGSEKLIPSSSENQKTNDK